MNEKNLKRPAILPLLGVLFLLSWACSTTPSHRGPSPSSGAGVEAVRALARRVLGGRAGDFLFQALPGAGDRDWFELEDREGKILVRGSSPLALASGLHWYLKHFARCQLSWCGDQLRLPDPLPPVGKKVRRTSPYRHGFSFNFCTFSYSMPWWTWKRWEREIDFMALCGIDMPLAFVGSEALWLEFLRRFGYSKKEALAFIAGPAYQAWWLLGNLEGRGGPVTDAWIENRKALEKRILARMRSLGMTPVLPGFVGLVPSNLGKKFPAARLVPQGKWGGPNRRPWVLASEDPLFPQMARAWYQVLDGLYGRTGAFAGDLFHEGGRVGGLNVPSMASQVQAAMLRYNPEAVWVLQAWGGNPRKDLLSRLRKDRTLVVDLCCEYWSRWKQSKGFGGFPWVFSTIIDYGANTALHGRMDAIARNLAEALSQPPGLRPVGLGATWEGIENNPVVFDFLWDLRWREKVPDLEEWIQEYAVRRYGVDLPCLKKAWLDLLHGPYKAWPGQRRPGESIFCARPSLRVKKVSPFAASIKVHYDQRILRRAVQRLLEGAPACRDKETYRYDLVDFTRQFLANAGQVVYKRMVRAFEARDRAAFDRASRLFLRMLRDQDRLLGTNRFFLLGRWLHDALSCTTDPVQARRNQRQARLLVTTWNPERSVFRDYGWKEWNGMLRSYYGPRWEMFIGELKRRLAGKRPRKLDFYPFDAAWAARTWEEDPYPWKPSGDPISACREILGRYGPILDGVFPGPTGSGSSMRPRPGRGHRAEPGGSGALEPTGRPRR